MHTVIQGKHCLTIHYWLNVVIYKYHIYYKFVLIIIHRKIQCAAFWYMNHLHQGKESKPMSSYVYQKPTERNSSRSTSFLKEKGSRLEIF